MIFEFFLARRTGTFDTRYTFDGSLSYKPCFPYFANNYIQLTASIMIFAYFFQENRMVS